MQTTKGFSLVECMVAMVILMVGILATSSSLARVVRFDANNSTNASAMVIAQQEAEQIVHQYRAMKMPCTGSACGSFVDLDGKTVNLTDIPSSILGIDGNIDFSTAAQPGYQKTLALGNGSFDVRWNITTVTAHAGNYTYTIHQITVGVKPQGSKSLQAVNIHVAIA